MKTWMLTAFLIFVTFSVHAVESSSLSAPAQAAVKRLKREGFKKDFIELVENAYDESTRNDIVALNVLGFLSKPADYEKHFSTNAVKETLRFLKENSAAFEEAKALHRVDPEVIAALLWVETKHGRQLGSHSVAGVYFSLLQADQPAVIEATQEALKAKVDTVTSEYKKKIRKRSQAKAKWAVEELRALARIKKKNKDAPIESLKGSYAGAFGFSQFIPSAYYRYAKAADLKSTPNLFHAEDAIQSIAYYLKKHGYKSNSLKAQKKALFGYNQATGYVDVILKIADCAKREEPDLSKRKLASEDKTECVK